jgi:hypothetical protein
MLQEFITWIPDIHLWDIEAQADVIPNVFQKAAQLPKWRQWVSEVTQALVSHKPDIHPAANDVL